MYHYTYKIEFTTGHWYIGKRSSKIEPELDIKYQGSGKLLGVFKKNHKEFTKIILATYDTDIEALDGEKKELGDRWSTESMTKGQGLCLNMIPGGGTFGVSGENHINYGRVVSNSTKDKMSKSRSGENNYLYKRGDLISGKNNPFFGKSHSDETKEKISQANTGRLIGDKNPRFGIPCVHKGKKGADHPMSKMKGEKNANFNKRQCCNLLTGQIKMFNTDDMPDNFYPWTPIYGFSDKEMRKIYPKELRGKWILL